MTDKSLTIILACIAALVVLATFTFGLPDADPRDLWFAAFALGIIAVIRWRGPILAAWAKLIDRRPPPGDS